MILEDKRAESDMEDGVCSIGSKSVSVLRDLEPNELNESKEVTDVSVDKEEELTLFSC